jgi:hypothetical protein
MLCVVAGPVQGRGGRARDVVGMAAAAGSRLAAKCGALDAALRDFGGIAMVQEGRITRRATGLETVVYGVVGSQGEAVALALRDRRELRPALSPVAGSRGVAWRTSPTSRRGAYDGPDRQTRRELARVPVRSVGVTGM